jgi:uncharacterized protein YheU (UPF0270 family)
MQYMSHIPYAELSTGALRGVVEAFILREGTDYGSREFSLDEKVVHVMGQLERGEAHIVFDPETQSVDIVIADRLRKSELPVR